MSGPRRWSSPPWPGWPAEATGSHHQLKEISVRTYKVGYFVGSLSSASINRILSKALIRLAPQDLDFTEIPIGNLPLYSPDFDSDYPPEPKALKDAIAASDAILFVTPEYNRSIPGPLKNAIDWASRPYGNNSFDHLPAAVIGASPGKIGTALAQQGLRAVLSFCNARQMTAPEAYITFQPDVFTADGDVSDESTATFLTDYMREFRVHIERVLTVIPRA
nr:NADPH-dependent FMN reductase [Actinopolymorpha rutila]